MRAKVQQILDAHEQAGDLARDHHLYTDAARQYQDALNLHATVPAARLRISEKLANALLLGNDPSAAHGLYDRLTSSYLGYPEDSAAAVKALVQTAYQLWIASKTEAALPVLAQAIHVAELQSDRSLLKSMKITMASYLSLLARFEEAEKFLDAMGEITDTDSAAIRMGYWVRIGVVKAASGRKQSAFESFDRAVHIAQNHRDVLPVIGVWVNYAFVATLLGPIEFAKTCYERALLIARRNNVIWRIPDICSEYATLLARMGQQELANEYLLDALSYDANAPILDHAFAGTGIPLALHMKDGATLARCTRWHAIDRAFLSGEPGRIGNIAAAFARLYMEQGHRYKAQALLHRAVNAVHHLMDAWELPLEVARCGAPADIPQARRLLGAPTALPCADLAKAHLLLFDAFVAQRHGHTAEARVQARDAAMRFDTLRWNAYADLARSILPARERVTRVEAVQVKPLSDVNIPLTEREREIAALVLKGLTSRVIAAKLSISPHTVDSHVNSIMNRLGIRSRHQLVYVLTEPGA